ncbi:3-phenylpropionate/cinnamic acid dioxygenase ferredoxin--NAD(+) reductase subunit [Entomohabitans teleogrylli]|uniref:3-phenylpropionate/cinnamic acid dioxygenase ferredoxin--NAD(+) reductase subunit n=1 Tax=Entomohabitans teleogrylli TaxID=1384589 RepID=UPI00073DAF7E|nr:3-phenylpropionate/cinnamic acid dioxygenase ferredoxin--NAD(+) reductase subunit [Entomohabitans teleogrylli]
MTVKTIIIVGGGQAAAMAAATLRQLGFDGALSLLSDEAHLPYERPPLSKAMLLDEQPALQEVLPQAWWRQHHVDVRLNTAVTAIDSANRQLTLHDGRTLNWDRLLLATGAAARPYPLLDALGDASFTLRHAADAMRLRQALFSGQRVVIVGAGTIGLELASSAVQRGCAVTVVEMAPVVMGRNAPEPVRDYLLARHRARGVRFQLGTTVEAAQRNDNGITLTLQNGVTLNADLVVYGIGIIANDALAQRAGLETANGIVVDSTGRTTHPAIYAAGDVTLVRQSDGTLLRRETWENASQQAATAAAAMCGLSIPVHSPPWFWTDQYDDNLQFVGDVSGDGWLQRGCPQQGKALWFRLRDGALCGAVALNQGREVRILRKLILSGCRPDPAWLVDESVALKSL